MLMLYAKEDKFGPLLYFAAAAEVTCNTASGFSALSIVRFCVCCRFLPLGAGRTTLGTLNAEMNSSLILDQIPH